MIVRISAMDIAAGLLCMIISIPTKRVTQKSTWRRMQFAEFGSQQQLISPFCTAKLFHKIDSSCETKI